jgi:hypothetical protein
VVRRVELEATPTVEEELGREEDDGLLKEEADVLANVEETDDDHELVDEAGVTESELEALDHEEDVDEIVDEATLDDSEELEVTGRELLELLFTVLLHDELGVKLLYGASVEELVKVSTEVELTGASVDELLKGVLLLLGADVEELGAADGVGEVELAVEVLEYELLEVEFEAVVVDGTQIEVDNDISEPDDTIVVTSVEELELLAYEVDEKDEDVDETGQAWPKLVVLEYETLYSTV